MGEDIRKIAREDYLEEYMQRKNVYYLLKRDKYEKGWHMQGKKYTVRGLYGLLIGNEKNALNFKVVLDEDCSKEIWDDIESYCERSNKKIPEKPLLEKEKFGGLVEKLKVA